LGEALAQYGCTDIFNTDQSSQFTAVAFSDRLSSRGISISMDGRDRWRDKVLIELILKSIKCEDIYLKAHGSMVEVQKGLADYYAFYIQKRWHQSLDRKTSAMVYFSTNSQRQVAA
jgi:putative transposase